MSFWWSPAPAAASADAGVTVALTGQSLTVARGTLTPTVAFALAGQSLTAARGQVLQGAPLTGQSVTAARGSLTPATSIALTGQSVSVARGSVAVGSNDVTVALTGLAAFIAQGSINPQTITPPTRPRTQGWTKATPTGSWTPSDSIGGTAWTANPKRPPTW